MLLFCFQTAAEKLEVGDYANGISSEMSTEHSGSGCSSVNHTDENFEDSLNMEPPKCRPKFDGAYFTTCEFTLFF